jgi:hypothetical protein
MPIGTHKARWSDMLGNVSHEAPIFSTPRLTGGDVRVSSNDGLPKQMIMR